MPLARRWFHVFRTLALVTALLAIAGGYAVGIARFTGSMWTYETAIQDADGNSYSTPSLAIDGHDGLHVAWVGYYDGALYYANKAGGAWTSGVALGDGSCCDTAYIAVNPAGAPFITYQTKDGTYAVASRSMAMGPWSESALHPEVSKVGNLAFGPTDPFHYLLLDKAGELLHGSPSGLGWKESVISTEAKQFMLAVDASERTHVIMATPQALKYVRLNKE